MLDRRAFLGRLGTGVAAATLFTSACEDSTEDVVRVAAEDDATRAEHERSDASLLVAAAKLEEIAIRVYTTAAGLPFIQADAAVLGTAGRFMGQHAQHRDALLKAAVALGQGGDVKDVKLPPIPPVILDGTKPDDERKRAVIVLARGLELEAAKAYHEYVVRRLRTDYARRLAADILPVEAQHVALYDFLLGAQAAPRGFFTEHA